MLLPDLAPLVAAELYQNILPFWSGPAVDLENGGWMGWLGNDLKPDRSQPKGLVLHSRVLWTFSASFRARPDQNYQRMAERAFDFLLEFFYDRQFGGAFWSIDDRGNVLDDTKHILGQAFFIYGLTEFHRSFHSARALHLAGETFGLLERHAHDVRHGGYFEQCRRDWSLPKPRLPWRRVAKSMSGQLHVLEAYCNLHGLLNDVTVTLRLRELIVLFTSRIFDPHWGHLRPQFGVGRDRRSGDYNFGHDIEASWLLCRAAEIVGDANVAGKARDVALRLAASVLQEGLAPAGGLYHKGKAGRIIDEGHEGWPQAEALIGFLSAYRRTGEIRYLDAFSQIWRFIEKQVSDPVQGDWHARIGADGRPDLGSPKVSFWKDPYHASRACLEILRRAGSCA